MDLHVIAKSPHAIVYYVSRTFLLIQISKGVEEWLDVRCHVDFEHDFEL